MYICIYVCVRETHTIYYALSSKVLLVFQDILMEAELGFLDDTGPNIMGLLEHLIAKAILRAHPQHVG